MQSIIQADKECFLTGRTDWLEKHHVFGGANRKNYKKGQHQLANEQLAEVLEKQRAA